MGLDLRIGEDLLEAGCDEAGRGCLAGPVVAAAVILDPQRSIKGLNDSKKLSANIRTSLAEIVKSQALYWGIGVVSPAEIDQINILQASILAMHLALDDLGAQPSHLAIDGNKFKNYKDIPHTCVIKGDSKFQHIAAASILAKTFRDEWMKAAHLNHPEYGWNQNMGYPTVLHRDAIIKFGLTPHHRKSFKLTKPGLQTRLPL